MGIKYFFYGQTLWDYGVNDIPEVMALDPEEAVWVVLKARELYWARPPSASWPWRHGHARNHTTHLLSLWSPSSKRRSSAQSRLATG
jgi:hypothetical protein